MGWHRNGRDHPVGGRIKGYEAGGYVTGMTQPGNIDLHNRPIVKNSDGSYSTVRSITIGGDGEPAYLIPTVVGNKVVSNAAAVQHFRNTGEHLGKFNTSDNADAYAQNLHEAQAQEYGQARGGKVRKVMKVVAKKRKR